MQSVQGETILAVIACGRTCFSASEKAQLVAIDHLRPFTISPEVCRSCPVLAALAAFIPEQSRAY